MVISKAGELYITDSSLWYTAIQLLPTNKLVSVVVGRVFFYFLFMAMRIEISYH